MNPNTPAFPGYCEAFGSGMTLRQYAAIQIAAGLAASEFWPDNAMDGPEDDTDSYRRYLAKLAVRTADVLLAELEKEAK